MTTVSVFQSQSPLRHMRLRDEHQGRGACGHVRQARAGSRGYAGQLQGVENYAALRVAAPELQSAVRGFASKNESQAMGEITLGAGAAGTGGCAWPTSYVPRCSCPTASGSGSRQENGWHQRQRLDEAIDAKTFV